MHIKAFFNFIQVVCYHSDCLGDWMPRLRYVPEESSSIGGIRYDLTHSLQQVLKLLHDSDIHDDRLALSHVVVFIFYPDDANLAWVSGFIFVDKYVPYFACNISIVDHSLELRCNTK